MSDYPTPEQQLDALWMMLEEHNKAARNGRGDKIPKKTERKWPSYDAVVADVMMSDYSENLRCPHDLRHRGGGNGVGKTLCPNGVICRAKIELFPRPPSYSSEAPYTGLLAPGQTLEHCILRLSSATRPPNDIMKSSIGKSVLRAAGSKLRKARLFPCSAIKILRGGGVPSGNVLLSNCKTGQQELNYFQHCQCTQLTEKMPAALKPFTKPFWKYSNHPFSLGLSDLCSFEVDGVAATDVNFPYVLIISPVQKNDSSSPGRSRGDCGKKERFDCFLDDVAKVPPGTVLFDLFACPSPSAASDPSRLQRIGRILTTSSMVPSFFDDGLFFRHQRREEDWKHKPDWERAMSESQVVINGRAGSVAKFGGWRLFENHIAEDSFQDFESHTAEAS